MNIRLIVIAAIVSMFVFASPIVAFADEPAATPDPGYGGVPLCTGVPEDIPDVNCVPDPGPKPQGGKIPSDIVEGEWNCVAGTIPTTVISYTIIDYYVGADNLWHPIFADAGSHTFDRPMDADELAQCAPVIVTDPIEEEVPADSGETVEITPEPIATEDLTEEVPEQVIETDEPAQTPAVVDESVDAPVANQSAPQVTALPNTGSGTSGGDPYWIPLLATASVVLAWISLRVRRA